MICFILQEYWDGLSMGYLAYGSANTPVVDEKEFLGNQTEFLENQLQQVRKRLKVLNEETE